MLPEQAFGHTSALLCPDVAKMTHSASPICSSVLSVAGSDSGGGAGIQADLKTFAAFGVHGLTAVAALTAQTTRGVSAVHLPPVDFLRAQMDDLFADFDIRAVKIGMLADAERIRCVAEVLRRHPHVPVVLDPVMVASSGARLLATDAVEALRAELLPLSTVVTPNLPEAEVLLGYSLNPGADLAAAAATLSAAGAEWTLLKGGHLEEGALVIDRLYGRDGSFTFRHPRLQLSPHGTGCTLSAAVAARLAAGSSVPDACDQAIKYVYRALQHSYRPGLGELAVLGHFPAASSLE
jgi:hydroxymethylpyrimidine/phosphomethylpyrimidine kinase